MNYNEFALLIDKWLLSFATFMWGTPLLVLLLGGGTFFTVYSRFLPFRYLRHGINILLGKYDDSNDPGQINHFQALSSMHRLYKIHFCLFY